jgi:prevent-host-death family protein
MTTEAYTSAMPKAPHPPSREVGIRELRDRLSHFLDEVEAGRELIVTDRGRPVARILATSGDAWIDQLVAAGIVTLPERGLDLASFGRIPSKGDVMQFFLDQRR